MNSKIKNILIFVVIGAILASIYFFFFSKKEEPNIVSSSQQKIQISSQENTERLNGDAMVSSIGKDFLVLLLNVRNIRLNDSIFSDPAFSKLRDSSIQLIPDGNEGRPNPFAPIGFDIEQKIIQLPSISIDTSTEQTENIISPDKEILDSLLQNQGSVSTENTQIVN